MHRLGIILLSAVVASGALRQSISAQTPPDKITLGTITLSLNNLPIYVAQDKGFFAKENLFVEAVVLNASTRAIPALIGGSTQISASSAMTTIRAVEKGANLKIVGGLINAPVYDLYAPAKYKSIKELKGATIGVTGLITSDTVLMKEMLKANGLEYPRDYAMLAIGGTPERWLAMQSGQYRGGHFKPALYFRRRRGRLCQPRLHREIHAEFHPDGLQRSRRMGAGKKAGAGSLSPRDRARVALDSYTERRHRAHHRQAI